ncbi:MAG TPA: hypothetical protein PLH70_00890 [Bacteroidales bacterium]|nr:hypothetical protein [Bacteroidales bacterium]HQB74342.1 hypothetical protein [Bacteroidales bacterium]
MNTVISFVVQQIAAFGFIKGLDKIFSNKEDFSQRLYKVINKTIEEYQQKYPIPYKSEKFAFYNSETLIEELLKYRLFSISGYSLDFNKIQSAIESNPNIIKPTDQELECFFQLFDKYARKDEKLKTLEIEKFHKETIFEIYEKVKSIYNLLDNQLIKIIPLLEEEYREEIKICFEEIKELKVNTALKHLTNIEERVNKNVKHISKKAQLQANLKFLEGVCYKYLGLYNEAYEHFIYAFKQTPEDPEYTEKACISYYFLKNPKYKELKQIIEKDDEFNAVCWAIDTIESDNLIEFINKKVHKNVLVKHYYQRLIFNINLSKNRVDSLKLIEALSITNLELNLPTSINYDNLDHWIYILNKLSIPFFTNTEVPIMGFLIKNETTIRILKLLELLTEAIKNSELDAWYNIIVFNYYWLQSEIDFQPDTIINLKNAYKSLKNKDPHRTMLLANSIQKHESSIEALKLINEYKGTLNENLVLLKNFCQLSNSQNTKSVLEYFEYIKYINDRNIQNICSFLIPIIKSHIVEKEKLIELLNNKQYSKQPYQDLVLLLTETLYLKNKPLEISKIDNLKDILEQEEKLLYFISLLYFENKYYDECIEFQKGYVDKLKESRDLFLYIKALNSGKRGNQSELLMLLKNWRHSFSFNDSLLRIELELQLILKRWDEIKEITEYGLTKLPKDETFFTLYITSLSKTSDNIKIEAEIKKIKTFSFNSTENAIKIAHILVKENYLEEGLELLYKKATNKQDSIARINYFSLTINLPQKYFKNYDTVIDDCYVKFEINGEIQTMHICRNTASLPIIKKSKGKKVQDIFNLKNQLTGKFKNVKILKIMNKYLALIDDIMTEANSSFSNLPIESISYETSDKDSFEKSLVEHFSTAEEERKKHIKKRLYDYRNYKIPFSELIHANFNGSYIDAFYYLTSSKSDGYIVKPIAFQNKSIVFENKELIIDFSSGLLFFELSKKLNLGFDKFIVSGNIYPLIDNLINETENQRKSKMAISINNNKIIPYFYSEDFHDKRIDFLIDIKKWFNDNSKSVIPEEKIGLIRDLYNDGQMTSFLDYIVDNAVLSERANHVLITDDMTYEKTLKINNWAGSEKYLLYLFPEKKNEILEAMLAFRFIGISTDSDLLYSSYINCNKEGYSHIYYYALRNIALSVNFNTSTILYAVDFLRKLAMSPAITTTKYKYDATNLFVTLISNFPKPELSILLKNTIQEKFNLLGEYLDITIEALLDALRILSYK